MGKISKQWSGLAKEVFTDTDNFGISFPLDLDVKMKATLLGAVFLIVSSAVDLVIIFLLFLLFTLLLLSIILSLLFSTSLIFHVFLSIFFCCLTG